LFLFQSDGGDGRGYLVLDFISGKDNGLEDSAVTILLFSLFLYIAVIIWIVISAKRSELQGPNHSLLIPSIIITLILPFLVTRLFYKYKEKQEEDQIASTGEYSDIRRAIREKDNAIVLRINPYESSYSSFPADILKLENLKELYLTQQKITSIPDDIGRLKQLEVLDLVNNDINVINPAICNCKNLKDLRVGGTTIQTLPDCLTKLDSLTNLTIQSNTVNTLMDELRKFKMVKTAHFYTKGVPFDREKWWKLTGELGIE